MRDNRSTTLDTVAMCLIIVAMAVVAIGHLRGLW